MDDRVEPSFDAAAGVPEGGAVWDIENDALAHALSWLTRHHGRERSPESLLSSMGVTTRLGPDQAMRALRDAGFTAGLVQRKVSELNAMLLPAVLLLQDNDACIVVARQADGRHYDVVMPGREHHACVAAEEELNASYTGIALVATPQVQYVPPAEDASLLADPSQHWFWGTLRRFIPYYRSALTAASLSNVLMLATGLCTSVIYDKVIPNQAFATLWWLGSGGLLALLFDLMARQLRVYLIDMAGRKSDLIVGLKLFRQSLAIRMEHRPSSAGAFAHQIGQIEMVREFFASATLSAISDLPFMLVFIGMTFVIGGPLGFVPALAVPVLIVLSVLIQGALRRAMMTNMHQQADLHGVLVEAVDGIEDIKAAGAQGRFLRHYEESTVAATQSMIRSRSITAWTTNLSMVSQQLITLIILVWGVHLIADKVVSAGALIGAVMFSGRALAPLAGVVSLATRYQGARAAMRNLDKVMAMPVEREFGKAYVPRPEFTGHIGMQGVGFEYPLHDGASGDAAPKVLHGMNLQFPPGSRAAILGRIGSGKSTVLRLLGGLYQPTEGQVEANGIDLRQIDPADFRARVGFVSQDPRLFHGSLRDNVLLDRPTADPARLAQVARLTGLDRLVASHPKGWELPVGEAGQLLSGGQRQLVALARCLVTQPRILLMDEPTSSMDAQSEAAFVRQLKEAVGGCTLVVVTHRPAVLELVDRILVVDGGKVVMDGPKDQVLAVLSGRQQTVPETGQPSNLHMHPSAQPVQREASV